MHRKRKRELSIISSRCHSKLKNVEESSLFIPILKNQVGMTKIIDFLFLESYLYPLCIISSSLWQRRRFNRVSTDPHPCWNIAFPFYINRGQSWLICARDEENEGSHNCCLDGKFDLVFLSPFNLCPNALVSNHQESLENGVTSSNLGCH